MKDIIVDTNKVTKNDYPELEGKIIQYSNGKNTYPAVVIGLNRSVGITIVHANDKDYFAICAPGPIMPDFKENSSLWDVWDEFFDLVVKSVQEGKIKSSDLVALETGEVGFNSGGASGDNCAYSR